MQAIVIATDQDEKDVLTFVLRKAGLAVASSSETQRVLAKWTEHPADLVLVALGEKSAPVKVVEMVREVTQVPLLMVTDALSEKDHCTLLSKGADLVLVRPVSPGILAAYVQALTRRSNAVPSFVLPAMQLENITLDPSTRTILIAGAQPRRLTQLEFRLLYLLMTNRGQVIPFEAIIERVWGYSGEGSHDLVRGLISRLRQKIETDPKKPQFLETISGVGYRFTVDDI